MVRTKVKVMAITIAMVMVMVIGCNSATVQAYINLATQIALQVAVLAGAPQTQADRVSGDLAKGEALYNSLAKADVAARPGVFSQIDAVMVQAEADLTDIFALSHIANPKLQGDIRAALAIGVTAIESARAIMLGKQPAPNPIAAAVRVALPRGVTQSKRMSPGQLKGLYNLTVADYPQAQIK